MRPTLPAGAEHASRLEHREGTASNALPRLLYHGTRTDYLDRIREAGLVPRQLSGNSQWEHSVASREDAVYLTTAYPLHFAANAQGNGDVVILEVATSALSCSCFIADEDAIALYGQSQQTTALSVRDSVLHSKTLSHHYPAGYSLKAMGTCAHLGPIPAGALTRAAIIRKEDLHYLILSGFDPVISPLNYQFFGQEYEQSIPWLFGDVMHCALNLNMQRPSIEVVHF